MPENQRQPLAMATPYVTPKNKKGSSTKSPWKSAQKTKAVDVVTGKATVEYFFDPSLMINKSGNGAPIKTPANDQDPLFFASKHLYMPCTIIKPLEGKKKGKQNGQPYPGPTLVKTADGMLHQIKDSTKLIALQSPEDYVGLDDVLHLPAISEASLLNTLRMRFKRDDIYTAAGPILISVNPYRPITLPDGQSIYSEEQMLYYRTQSDFQEKPPHLFTVADRAYTALMESVHASSGASHVDDEDPVMMLEHHTPPGTVRNQSIIISGESGAGKTEATKIIMKYLARITRKSDSSLIQSADGKMIAALEDRVLSSNPLLETFGNAQTLRNDNSSRFGKFIHIYFNTVTGSITSASISNYLLEKTRITHQVEGERNYHVFYQLLSGADDEMLQEFGLQGGVSAFSYLGNRDSDKMEKDSDGFKETLKCLESIGLTKDEQKSVFGIAAAVLHLGNLQFERECDDDDHARITESSRSSLSKACELLGIDEMKLSEAILTKMLTVNGKSIKKQQNVAMAMDKRDAMAKMTYACLFLWLVKCINETLSQASQEKVSKKRDNEKDQHGFIGVLDIYGFECFDTNGFEQLLINYCNEKLQRHFNRHLFEVEQQMYAAEGVDWSYITFNDNRPCLELIEGGNGNVGILNTLDDAWGGMGSAAEKDGKFVAHLHKLFGTAGGEARNDDSEATLGHMNFVTPKFGKDRQFIVVHYAGEVRYTADGFVEKNMDTLSNELRELVDAAQLDISKRVYASVGGLSSSQRSSIRGISVGSQFRTSLQSLVADLERTQPLYIRCIKPNLTKAAAAFMSGEVLKQLRYSGMMEAIRIRREGYAFREEHESFYHRFSVLLTNEDMETDEPDSGISHLVKVLSKRLHVSDADWQIGHSKIFLRRELADKLERLAKLRVHVAARTLGKFGRHVVNRRLASLLVSWVRFRLHMLKTHRQHRAATKLCTAVRCYLMVKKYALAREAAVRIQAEERRRLAYRRVRKMRDPFIDMSFRECKSLLLAEQRRLDDAIAANDFRLAADLEAKVASITEAVERKRPETRSVLEKRIQEVQTSLDNAVKRKAFSECGPLQDRLEELTAKCLELPTIDELRSAVAEAQAAIADAAKRRDFVAAAKAQDQLEVARNRLAESLAADDVDEDEGLMLENKGAAFRSRAQLESDIAEIAKQIKSAIDMKDFRTASSLQVLMDERDALRKLFPSVEELRANLDAAKTELKQAVSCRNFARAGELDGVVADLETKLEVEISSAAEFGQSFELSSSVAVIVDGQQRTIKSRGELEEEIAAISHRISDAVALRAFKKADDLQAIVDNLIQLRTRFPTMAELKQKLRQKTNEMNIAIANKEFAKANEINAELEALERAIEEEKGTDSSGDNTKSELMGNTSASVNSTPVFVGAAIVPSGASVKSAKSAPVKSVEAPAEIMNADSSKSVRRLRPAKPLLVNATETIVSVAQQLAKKRGSASVIVDTSGRLAGIVTDTDFTRRVVARHVDITTTSISSVMTPHPTCVSVTDPAIDALTTMIENHFRHLPVVDDSGSVVGLLDISRCLNDAIAKLEGLEEESSVNTAEEVMKQVALSAGEAQATALQALLEGLLTKSMGARTVPTLRTLLRTKPSTIVAPTSSVREAGKLMAESRKAALVVDQGRLVGIFGFKDMMSRVVAKELPVDTTPIAEVMTPEPEFVSPDMTVLEALHTMADNRFLTLPVCEQDGRVIGLVDVMDVMYGCGGTEGWRSVFSSAMDIDDEASDVSSINSNPSSFARPSPPANSANAKPGAALQVVSESVEERPVSTLRPRKPIIVTSEDSILRTVKVLSSKRASASLIVDSSGTLAGILTDKDITCRVVAKDIDPSITPISLAMTPDPYCVSLTDAAMDALTTMIENRFRHLPVVDEQGAVVGLLDISKCLTSVIIKLEKLHIKSSNDMQKIAKEVISQQGAGGAQAAALQTLLSNLMSQGMGSKPIPTLRSLLQGKPATVVSPSTSIYDVGCLMAEHRRAALVVDDGKLVGIFGFKDMMTRAVSQELPLKESTVADVMTPDPTFVPPDMNVLEAIQIMADSRFLTLPICENDGHVVGVVDVMDVMYGCGGSDGWRSIFRNAIELTDDTSSASGRSFGGSARSGQTGGSRRAKIDRTVEKLRPSKPHLSLADESVLSVAQLLKQKRGDASLVVHAEGNLAGIITDTDFTRRVVAKSIDPATVPISEVMTPDPTCVSLEDSAMDALTLMVENHFRHLPVVDVDGSVVGVLDIGKCLNDAIEKLEKSSKSKVENSAEVVVKQLVGKAEVDSAQAAALHAILGSLMAKAVGGKSLPTLRSILNEKPSTIVSPSISVREAGILMAESRKAALVVDSGRLVGIFGFKDMMNRVVAKAISPDTTAVSDVMTPDPEFVTPDLTVLDALQTMYDHKFLTLPVCESHGRVVGLVDVMDVIYGCGGTEGWRSIFTAAAELDYSETASRSTGRRQPEIPAGLPNNIPSTLEFNDDQRSFDGSTIGGDIGRSMRFASPDSERDNPRSTDFAVFKVVDPSGNTHRVKCVAQIEVLLNAVAAKAAIPRRMLRIQYIDEEGDIVVMTSDDDVAEAWLLARKAGVKFAKITAVMDESNGTFFGLDPMVGAIGAGVLAAICGAAIVVLGANRKAS